MAGSRRGRTVVAALGVPLFFLTVILSIVLVSSTARAACNPDAPALRVNPTSVPEGPIAGYDHEQLVNAAHVMLAAQQLGLTQRDQQIGVMTAMGESSLRILDHGDAVGPDSRGLFQQRDNGAWGTYEDRMDPFVSSTSFYRVEMTISERASMEPTLVAHQVQRNADPYHYEPYWAPAGQVVRALGGIEPLSGGMVGPAADPTTTRPATGPSTGSATPTATSGPTGSTYHLGPVQPQTVVVANTLGPMFGITTIGGWRPPETERYDKNGHPAGLALDFMVFKDKATGDRLAAYIQQHADELGVKYVIWYQRIWSPVRASEGWRPMADRGSITQNHKDHVHLSLTGDGSSSLAGMPAGPAGCDTPLSTAVSTSGWAQPAKGPMTSDFGPRGSPGGIGSTWHHGIDLGGGGCDGPIWAANAGVVTYAGPSSGYGTIIDLDHGKGVHTRYGHMYDSGLLVRVGDQVKAGQQIAKVGSNGNSTGCHLHFEVILAGTHVDPAQFLGAVGVTIS